VLRIFIGGAGELHLEIRLNDLQEDFMGAAEITVFSSWNLTWIFL
jgi:translation elongation factor EF-G